MGGAFRNGPAAVDAVKLGASTVDKVYLGATQVFADTGGGGGGDTFYLLLNGNRLTLEGNGLTLGAP